MILAAIALLGLFSTEIEDADFWWHLKTGQYLLQHHTLPIPDPFAYTTALNPLAYGGEEQVRHFNLTHEWLAQAALYGVYAIGGLPAVVLVRAAILTSLCALVGLLAARRYGNSYLGILASFATASLATWFTADRPAILTFLFVMVFIAVLELRRGLWSLPILAVIWANSHGGFFLGWVVLLAYCAESLPLGTLGNFRKSRWTSSGDRRCLWLAAAGSIAASGVNPNGFGVVPVLFKYHQSAMTAGLVEWQPPYLWGPPYSFDILLYAAALVMVISWRRVWLSDWLLFLIFAAASLMAFRNILLIGMLAPIMIAAYFPVRPRMPQALTWAFPVLLTAVLAIGFSRGSFFQLRAATFKFPAGAADYLVTNHVPGPLFNTYEYGGYLIWKLWPEYRVFIDGRAISESTNRDYRQILYNLGSTVDRVAGPRADLLNRYGIQAVVMNTLEYNAGAVYPLALALATSSAWPLVYDDQQSLLFVRDLPAGTQALQNKLQRVLDHMDTECSVNIEHSPEASLCARTLADFWMRSGDKVRARRMLELYLAHAMDRDPDAERALQQLNGAAGRRQ